MNNMYNKKYLAKRPFLLVMNTMRPARGANTAKAGWGDENGGQWAVFENINFVDRVRDKDLIKAHVVIDVLEAKVIKSSFKDAGHEEVLKHYLSKYKKETTEAVGIWMERKAQERARAGLPPEEVTNTFAIEAGSEDISAKNIEQALKQVAAEREAAIANRAEEIKADSDTAE